MKDWSKADMQAKANKADKMAKQAAFFNEPDKAEECAMLAERFRWFARQAEKP